MIKLLSSIGRATIIVAALLTIVVFAVGGYAMGTGQYGAFASGGAQGAGGWGAVLGGILGIIVAGAVFGPIATLYDIRDNIRRMALRA
jgi:uncharacterized protein YqgC (DUF456 family)